MIKMQKIFVNGQQTTIEGFVNLFNIGGEFDFDSLGAILDSSALSAAINSFEEDYDAFELIEKYLQFAKEPIVFNYQEPEIRYD